MCSVGFNLLLRNQFVLLQEILFNANKNCFILKCLMVPFKAVQQLFNMTTYKVIRTCLNKSNNTKCTK